MIQGHQISPDTPIMSKVKAKLPGHLIVMLTPITNYVTGQYKILLRFTYKYKVCSTI